MNKKQQATDFYKEMVASIKEETATLGMSREELEIYEAKQAGLSEEQIRAIQLLQKSRKAREEENKLLVQRRGQQIGKCFPPRKKYKRTYECFF